MDLKIFESMPGNSMLLQADAPIFTVLAFTGGFPQKMQVEKQQLTGKGIKDVLPAIYSLNNLQQIKLEAVLTEVVSEQKEMEWNSDAILPLHCKPVLDEGGKVAYVILSQSNLPTGHQQTEKGRLVEQTYTLMMNAPMAICIIKGDEQIIQLANKHVLQIWRKGEDVVGKPLLQALPELKGSVFPDLLKKVRQTGKPHFENESHFYFLRGNKEELVYFNFVYQPYYDDENEKASGVLVVANEVTELVTARKKAEESELRFRNLIAGADVATAVYLGQEMRIQYANEAMIRLWGKDATVVGKTVREALPELEGQPFEQLLQNVYHTGKTYWGKEDKATLMVDGELKEFYFNFSYKALRNAEGEVYGILNMAIDVSNEVLTRQKIEESEANLQLRVAERTLELEHKNRELQHMNANLEEFAFAASHDLKEPVRKIHYFSDRLATQLSGRLGEEELRILNRMQHATRRMGMLIDDLLSFSQVNRGIAAVEEVNLKAKLEAVLEDLELEIAEKKAKVHYNDLPVIRGNKRQWQQLFQNIISNSLKYSRQGVSPQIHIDAQEIKGTEVPVHLPAEERENSFYKIEIKDNGIGFNQKDADRIFNIFTRLHGNAEYRGTGIGLSIVQKVVENHKGLIMAEGLPDNGATFKIFIPKAATTVNRDMQVEV